MQTDSMNKKHNLAVHTHRDIPLALGRSVLQPLDLPVLQGLGRHKGSRGPAVLHSTAS